MKNNTTTERNITYIQQVVEIADRAPHRTNNNPALPMPSQFEQVTSTGRFNDERTWWDKRGTQRFTSALLLAVISLHKDLIGVARGELRQDPCLILLQLSRTSYYEDVKFVSRAGKFFLWIITEILKTIFFLCFVCVLWVDRYGRDPVIL